MVMFKKAFTIVELLIVIVVVGVLAAITVVSYIGITNQANISTIKANIAQVSQKLQQYKIQNSDSYPLDKATAESFIGIKLSKYLYNQNSVTGMKNYCATYNSGGVSYSVTSTYSKPLEGDCVENMAIDPDAAGSTTHFSRSGSLPDSYSTTEISSLRSHHGDTSLRKVISAVHTGTGGAGATVRTTGVVPAGTRINYSGWVYATGSDTIHEYADNHKVSDGSYGCSSIGGASTPTAVLSNTWVYFSAYTVPGVDCTNIWVGGYAMDSLQVGDEVYFDQFMATTGDNFYNYGDGNSIGWFWTGDANASTSIGPAEAM